MNFQQLEYIVAVDTYKNFVMAAENCFVTQPTLSTMIQKLEDELNVKIFDRKKQPVATTEIGQKIIQSAKHILNQSVQLKQQVLEYTGSIEGDIKIGIIPTIAPYLLPLILNQFILEFPKLKITIEELTTDGIVEKIESGKLDLGIIATPYTQKNIVERPLYYEKFYIYTPKNKYTDWNSKTIDINDIKDKDLLLLEEGHCFRNQFLNICNLERHESLSTIKFEAGSLETLIHLVEAGHGITMIPELSLSYLPKDNLTQVINFTNPEPVREISLIYYSTFERNKLIEGIEKVILSAIKPYIENKKQFIVPINQ